MVPFGKTLSTQRNNLFGSITKVHALSQIYNDLSQHKPPKMPRKLQPKFIPNEAPEDTKIRKDLSVEKFRLEIELLQTRTERYKQ